MHCACLRCQFSGLVSRLFYPYPFPLKLINVCARTFVINLEEQRRKKETCALTLVRPSVHLLHLVKYNDTELYCEVFAGSFVLFVVVVMAAGLLFYTCYDFNRKCSLPNYYYLGY